jgi:2-methylisocitrate lyase-like PEP mutase family enzyme
MPAEPTTAEKVERFRALHVPGRPLLLANAWDAGTAVLFASLGFHALATTSSGFAATLGRRDGSVTRDQAVAHGGDIAAATELPVSADLENGFADDPAGVAETVTAAAAAGLAGCSIEDFTRDRDDPIYERALAVERVAAAVEAARSSASGLVITARAENYLHGRPDLDDTIARLAAFGEAGADVVYAPGCSDLGDIERLVQSVGRPVNVLASPNAPPVDRLAAAGVARVSVGGAFAYAALGAATEAARELLDHGTYGFWANAGTGWAAATRAFT